MEFSVIAADMAAYIGLVDFLNAQVFWDPKQCKISPLRRILCEVGLRSPISTGANNRADRICASTSKNWGYTEARTPMVWRIASVGDASR